ncbi:DNA-nicking Smr family endonuclease [Methylobacter tundripaludum]|uniref:DNA-nicking Smr family endonuclease n=1 Tax=Methylobacter tundripaludum TaxID=173365 RepID=A0A2S6H611_9GAMM|nr:Smr/MutS family protein [Methylobacter tundripaludum]PPK72881.1 DNA-nicking Smr family endonuclease [Methylobacter tundripaludum]
MAKKKLTPEDSDLFRQTIGKVQTVKSDKVLLTEGNKPKPYPKSQTVNVAEHLNGAADFNVENVGIEDSLSFAAPGLQHSVLKKLRKGQFGLDAEIDLHGLNSNKAKRQLLHFLHDCVEDGCRCVHIIHGKGYRSMDNHPVLKNNLNLWLRQHKDVQAFCSAPPKDGGTGAVFVLLQLSEKYDA